MKTRLFTLVSLLVLFIAGCGVQQAPQELESLKVVKRLAVLSGSSGYPAANGKATYKVDNNGIKEFDAEIEDARVLAGKSVNVFVGTTKVGSIKLNAFGDGSLTLVGAAAPTIASSSQPVIRVRALTGVVVASGTMNQLK